MKLTQEGDKPYQQTPDEGPNVDFLKEVLAHQGNEYLRLIVQEHEDTTKAASDTIDEVLAERDATMASAADISAQFKQMAKTFRGPGQVGMSNLTALKEKIGSNVRTPTSN